MDIYLVKWYDAYCIEGWKLKDEMIREFDSGLIIESIGYLLKENDSFISIFQTTGSNGNLSGVLCIPKGCIIEKKKL